MEIRTPKEIPGRELLLHPLNMLHQIFAGLIPGVLAIFVALMKHSRVIPAAMSVTGMLGYKTRVVLAVVLAFVIGRIVQSCTLAIAVTARKLSEWLKIRTGNAATLTPSQEQARNFVVAVAFGTVLAKDGSAFDAWESQRAQIGMMLNAGLVLIAASFFPGDGLRMCELMSGLILFLIGIQQGTKLDGVKLQAVGSAVGQFLAAHTVDENKEIIKAVAPILPILAKHVQPMQSEAEPAAILKEVMEQGASLASVDNGNGPPNENIQAQK
jgi:hypothetical protein